MNKTILVAFIMTVIIIFSVRTVVKEVSDLPDTEITGIYYYSECIYLHPMSSSTIDSQTEVYMHKLSFDLDDYKFTIYDRENDITKRYWDIEYAKVDVYLDIDDFSSLQLDEFLESVDSRYNIYSEDTKLEYIIFFSGENIFIAETQMIGGGNTVFTIFTIFSVGKLVNTFT